MEIIKIPYNRLLKLEFPEMAQLLINAVEWYEPETLLIKEIFDKLVEQTPQIESLKVGYGPHPITEELAPLRKKRLMYAANIVHKMGVILVEDENVKSKEVREAKILINLYLLYLGKSRNEDVINQKLTQFFREVETNVSFSAALRTFDFMGDIENLELSHADVQSLLRSRLQHIKQRPKAETAKNVKSIRKALTNLFMQIEVAKVKHPELDYNPLIKDVNGIIEKYIEHANMRDTINKRKAEEKKRKASAEFDVNSTGKQNEMLSDSDETKEDCGNENNIDQDVEQKKDSCNDNESNATALD